MEAVAKLRNCPMSPRKMRLVVDLIRGKKVNEALNILKFTKKEASTWLEKLLLSAINNWEQKHGGGGADSADLFVKTAFVDGGMVNKKFQPDPHGRRPPGSGRERQGRLHRRQEWAAHCSGR